MKTNRVEFFMSAFPLAISVIALSVSLLTAWMTLFRRGSVRMTRPTVIFFGPDGRDTKKVFLRALLISTGKRGRIIENMYVLLTGHGRCQPFNIWVYDSSKTVRGSGLFVGETGVEANHHFLLPDGPEYRFQAGRCHLEVYANLLGSKRRRLLFSCDLELTTEHEALLAENEVGLYFDWLPEQSRYAPHIDRRQKSKSLSIEPL